ncbi:MULTISPECIES: TadE/TadG family type IV pilus assembly protein [unclassified Janthinobacterium]|uniref:TadE/TadG family type IV pilus assembly protein n=1 Tax=unclassified Janthinobacterium TaxID=2610881 RepID=UPI0008F4A31F|nr:MULTISPECIES: TadE/TadG family type IV pilus assembly protein [unclassified Janthinobacterium]APA70630.1 hypothetical protein YQ44_25640 [Janthinobacterium sp. 1_2014MBL_MicDiv]MDN2711251.1 pilus assembly protein [Janthinobacterium sp. SUN118]
MRPPYRTARRQRGVAAIELALILLFFMGLLPFMLLFGRALLTYTALQKSVHDAARYMATMPLPQMAKNGSAAQGAAFARQMVVEAMAESWPEMESTRVSVDCVYFEELSSCGNHATAPQQVRLNVTVDMPMVFLPELTRKWLPQLGPIPLRANVTMRYVN